MSNDVADCPYCDDGLITAGFEPICDRCGRKTEYPISFESRIDNNRYRKRIGLKELKE